MLPPGLENRSPHKYGDFNITIHTINFLNIMAESVSLNLLGMKNSLERSITSNEFTEFSFVIGTNLWQFYAYLNDARAISLHFKDAFNRIYNCQVHLSLMPSRQVLSKNIGFLESLFKNNSYLLNRKSKYDAYDARFAKVGSVQVQLNLSFSEPINRTLFQADLIDLEDILVIDEISPISSTIDLNNMTAQPSEMVPVPISSIKRQAPSSNIPQSLQHLEEDIKNELPVHQISISQMEDQKMMEDDIDRLIAQMQNRPYDSSKYMQEARQEPKKQNFNYTNFSLITAKSQSNEKKERGLSSQKLPPRTPPLMKTSVSRPQINVSPHSKFVSTISNPIISYSPQVSSMPKIPTANQNLTVNRQYEKKQGMIKLKVHEFTMSKIEKELSLLLKIYLNQDTQQFYSINGLRQGETISFNSNIKINQRRQIHTIKFVLIDSFDMKTIFAQGIFEMSRLFSLSPTTGIFMVNLLSPMPEQTQSKILKVQQKNLVRVIPNLKNLRIELEYQQTIQIVQIYMSLSEFSSSCRKICYKIPMTKESIEFKVSQLKNNKHINIFPHNRSSSNRTNEKIIVEIWGDTELIGFTEINLKPISNTNQAIINSSLQPILLYDQNKVVNDLKGGKNRASFLVNLYYGNVAQVQNILNKEDTRQKKIQKGKKIVQVENHLGIYIKQNKQKKQVQIQVDECQMQPWKGSQKNLMVLQQQQLPDDDQDYKEEEEQQTPQQIQTSTQSKNEFMSQSMQQKYLANKQTVPTSKINIIPSPNISKSFQLSQTLKQKPFKSLTKEFQQQIKSALIDLATEQCFAMLKEQCESHLLYNFIESKDLARIMGSLGISQQKTNFLLKDVIIVSNDMINVIIMYDMIFELMLEGEVKEKYIDDGQIGRYCLMRLYNRLEDEQQEDFLFDDSTEFDQSRKIFESIQYKLTMRQFNLIHNFLSKCKENSNTSYQQIKKNLINRHI